MLWASGGYGGHISKPRVGRKIAEIERDLATPGHSLFKFANLATELPLSSKFAALLEMYSTWTWSNLITTPQGYQTPQTLLGILPGIEFLATEKWSMATGASIDMLGKNGVKKYTSMFTVYHPF